MEDLCKILLDETGKDICKIVQDSGICEGGMIGAGALLALFGILPLLAAIGFTSTGIVAGSLAAKIMALYGGNVAAGSFLAILQSLGAGGLSGLGSLFTAGIGGWGGWLLSSICNQTDTD